MDTGLKIEYAADNLVDNIEISGRGLKQSLTLKGKDVSKFKFEDALDYVKTLDSATEKTETGFFAPTLRLKAYERKGEADMFSICTKAYHDASLVEHEHGEEEEIDYSDEEDDDEGDEASRKRSRDEEDDE